LETEYIKLKTVGLSIAGVLMIETLAAFLNSQRTAPIIIIGAARSLEITILLVACCITEPNRISALGILPKHIRSGLFRGFLWATGFGLVVGLVAVILITAGLDPTDLIAANLPSTQTGLFFFLVVGGIISPVAEEIFFRGMLYGYFRRWGMWAALLLSTLLFVMAHAIFQRIPLPQIVGGILFAVAYEKEKNLMVPIVIHVLGNLAIFAIAIIK
jgi:membrane protease YdiL (CAAX protease family)